MSRASPPRSRTHVIACATVIEEMLPLMPPDVSYQVLAFGLHAYPDQLYAEPGTYYVTKGWLEVGELPFGEYEKLVERHGPARAERLMRLLLHNYTRLAFINTGQYALAHYRERAQEIAARFDLRYEEIPGSAVLVEKMLLGPWGETFVVVPPGGVLQQAHFFDLAVSRPSSA